MEETTWKRDETPYIIFRCNKCKRYLYVKKTQKSKKCLQCGHMHRVINISMSHEIVNGLTNAIKMVKERQNSLIPDEIEFSGSQEFRVASKQKVTKSPNIDIHYNLIEKFKQMLIEISKTYNNFPEYIIEVMAENYNIPYSEIKIMTRHYINKGFLIRKENNLYTIKTD